MTERIKKICESHINSMEFEKKAKKAEVDITWLEEKLCQEDMIKLEETITAYHVNNGKVFFESGFCFAWELFMECANKGKSKE